MKPVVRYHLLYGTCPPALVLHWHDRTGSGQLGFLYLTAAKTMTKMGYNLKVINRFMMALFFSPHFLNFDLPTFWVYLSTFQLWYQTLADTGRMIREEQFAWSAGVPLRLTELVYTYVVPLEMQLRVSILTERHGFDALVASGTSEKTLPMALTCYSKIQPTIRLRSPFRLWSVLINSVCSCFKRCTGM